MNAFPIKFYDITSRPFKEIAGKPQATVYCLGNFDGIHIAHAELIRAGLNIKARQEEAGSSPLLCGAFVFYKPSWDYFLSDGKELGRNLSSLEEKLDIFSSLGLDTVALCAFEDIKDMSSEDFLDLLYRDCECRGIVCGYNYRFGKGASGDPELIKKHFDGMDDVTVTVIPEIIKNGMSVSSSRIRELIKEGNVSDAALLLGRYYSLNSEVVHGKALGKTLGFPTANQFFQANKLIPKSGVYISRCHTPFGVYAGVSNIGSRPTVDNTERINCETHIIGFSEDLYGCRLTVEFICRLRDEQKFSDIDALKAAVLRDIDTARSYFEKNDLI